MTERQIHDGFIAWLKANAIPFVNHRMDRKSGIRTGWPDFTILWMSRAVCIEVKTEKGRVSLAQAKVIAFIKRSGNKVVICRSIADCVEAVKNILCEGKLEDELIAPEERPRFGREFGEMKQTVAKVPGNGVAIAEKPCAKRTNNFCIGKWHDEQYVFATDLDGNYRMIRKASASDVINFPALVL